MRRRNVSQASCRRWRRLHWRRLHWRRKEAPLHRLSSSITSIPLYLSLNLSALLQDLKRKENTKEMKKNTYTTLKIENLALKSKTTPKIKNCLILDLYRGIYRQIQLLEDETGPSVENRRVAPPHCRGSAAIPGTKVPGFGAGMPDASRSFLVYPNSGNFARIFV